MVLRDGERWCYQHKVTRRDENVPVLVPVLSLWGGVRWRVRRGSGLLVAGTTGMLECHVCHAEGASLTGLDDYPDEWKGGERRGEETTEQSRLGMTLSLRSPRVCYLSLPRPILQMTSVLFWRTLYLSPFPCFSPFSYFRRRRIWNLLFPKSHPAPRKSRWRHADETKWHHMMWCGIMWRDVASQDAVWHGMI